MELLNNITTGPTNFTIAMISLKIMLVLVQDYGEILIIKIFSIFLIKNVLNLNIF